MKAFLLNVGASIATASIVGTFAILWNMSKDVESMKKDIAVIQSQIVERHIATK